MSQRSRTFRGAKLLIFNARSNWLQFPQWKMFLELKTHLTKAFSLKVSIKIVSVVFQIMQSSIASFYFAQEKKITVDLKIKKTSKHPQ